MFKKEERKEGRRMGGRMFTLVALAIACFMMTSVAFASPVSNSSIQRETDVAVVWETMLEKASETDLRILGKYMDAGELARLKHEKNGEVSEILVAYCDFDADFKDVLLDYFA